MNELNSEKVPHFYGCGQSLYQVLILCIMHFMFSSGVIQLGVQGHQEQIGGTGHTNNVPRFFCGDLSGMLTLLSFLNYNCQYLILIK